MLFNIPNPILDILKTLFICYVIDEHDAHCAAVVGRRYGAEALLPSGVPWENRIK